MYDVFPVGWISSSGILFFPSLLERCPPSDRPSADAAQNAADRFISTGGGVDCDAASAEKELSALTWWSQSRRASAQECLRVFCGRAAFAAFAAFAASESEG